jgi:hypothetical protein
VFYLTSIGRGPRHPARRVHREADPAASAPREIAPNRKGRA